MLFFILLFYLLFLSFFNLYFFNLNVVVVCLFAPVRALSIQYNTIQYKHEYYYSGVNPVEFRGHSKPLNKFDSNLKNCNKNINITRPELFEWAISDNKELNSIDSIEF